MADDPHKKPGAGLLQSYRGAHYEVELPAQRVLVQVDHALPCALEQALVTQRCETAAVLSAANPRSCALADDENLVRHEELLLALRRQAIVCLPAVGSDPNGPWREISVLALGVDEMTATKLAEDFEQFACVALSRGTPARLVMTRHWLHN